MSDAKIGQVSVAINCYNYEDYVGEAIDSVGRQTVRPTDLLIIDDGSTDLSVKVATEACRKIGLGEVVSQENGGQLAAFQAAVQRLQCEWILFLDADDVYDEEHIENFLKYARKNPKVDCFFSDYEEFGSSERKGYRYRGPKGDIGCSGVFVSAGFKHANVLIGGVTSTMAIKKEVLDRFFPFSDSTLADWRIRADNVLAIGSSIAGARKFSLPEKTVKYRIHGENNCIGVKVSAALKATLDSATERLCDDLMAKHSEQEESIELLPIEYAGLPQTNAYTRRMYRKVVGCYDLGFLKRMKLFLCFLKADLRRKKHE